MLKNDDYFTIKFKLEVAWDALWNKMKQFQGRWKDVKMDIIDHEK
jgi:hypothetical protein